jgi:hypothetical protein
LRFQQCEKQIFLAFEIGVERAASVAGFRGNLAASNPSLAKIFSAARISLARVASDRSWWRDVADRGFIYPLEGAGTADVLDADFTQRDCIHVHLSSEVVKLI